MKAKFSIRFMPLEPFSSSRTLQEVKQDVQEEKENLPSTSQMPAEINEEGDVNNPEPERELSMLVNEGVMQTLETTTHDEIMLSNVEIILDPESLLGRDSIDRRNHFRYCNICYEGIHHEKSLSYPQ